jgi:enoyl-CoA hydratase
VSDSPVACEFYDHYAVVRLNRPAHLNRISEEVLTGLENAFLDLNNDSAKVVVILTGTSGIFSAGADLEEIAQLTSPREYSLRGQALMSLIRRPARTSIAAIDGFCIGGGFDLALSCDIRIATSRAIFQYPGARLGIITGWGGTVRLPRLIGSDPAKRILATAERIDATNALRLGIIDEICEDSEVRARERAEAIVARLKETREI